MRLFQGRPVTMALLAPLGLLAALERPLGPQRPRAWGGATALDLAVTSPRDAGAGSLREAIIAADRATARARIVFRVDRVVLETPLPPLVNRHGVVLDAERPVEIDARGVVSGPILDLAAPGSLVRGLAIKGAPGPAILVRASGARLRDLKISDCAEGVQVTEGVEDVAVADSTFVLNGTGVRVDTAGGRLTVTGTTFERHSTAAVWAVSPAAPAAGAAPRLVVRGNRFRGDRMSIVLVNVPAEVTDNVIAGATEAGVYLMGPATVRSNRIQQSALGVFADGADGASIENNELDHNAGVGVLVRGGRATRVSGNRAYVNGYGIAVVFGDKGAPHVLTQNLMMSQREDGLYVVGGSPILRDNRSLSNRGAGLRVLDYVPRQGPQVRSDPLVHGLVAEGNGTDLPTRGLFHEPEPEPVTEP
jgi:parallel beta-helix repeat protein